MSTAAENVVADLAANADATAQPTGEAESAPAGDPVATPVTPEEKAKNQERYNRLTRDRYEAVARADAAERRAREAEERAARLEASAKPQQVAPAKLPTLEEFGYDTDKHNEALEKHFAALNKPQPLSEEELVEKAAARLEQRQRQQQRDAAWEKREAEFVALKPDYVEKVYRTAAEGGAMVTSSMLEILGESEQGPAVLYHLNENVELSRQIARLPPHLQGHALGRIEAKLEAPKATQQQLKPPVSQAPPPTPTVTVADSPRSVSTTDPASDKLMNDDEWFKAENKRLARKAARK